MTTNKIVGYVIDVVWAWLEVGDTPCSTRTVCLTRLVANNKRLALRTARREGLDCVERIAVKRNGKLVRRVIKVD